MAAAIPLPARHRFCMVTASGWRDGGRDHREGETKTDRWNEMQNGRKLYLQVTVRVK